MPSVVAIVLNWRDAPSMIACVSSLFALDEDVGIVVVDNDSGDGSLERIQRYCMEQAPASGYRVVGPDEIAGQPSYARWVCALSSGWNGGYGFGNNVGIHSAMTARDCRYVWILNADVLVPEASVLTGLVAHMDADPGIGICGVTVCYADDPDCVQTLGGGNIDRRGRTSQFGQGQRLGAPIDAKAIEQQLDYINGACSFVRREFIEQVGPMSEDYFLYFEELDWSARGRGTFRLGYCPEAIVLHHVGKSIGTQDSGSRSALSTYYMNASRIRYCTLHLRGALPWVLVDVACEIARSIRRRQWRTAAAMACAFLRIKPSLPRRLGIF